VHWFAPVGCHGWTSEGVDAGVPWLRRTIKGALLQLLRSEAELANPHPLVEQAGLSCC